MGKRSGAFDPSPAATAEIEWMQNHNCTITNPYSFFFFFFYKNNTFNPWEWELSSDKSGRKLITEIK